VFGKFDSAKSSYTLCLSNLSQVWIEQVDQSQITEKAEKLQSLPIDVSSNTGFLLKCLSDVIYERRPEDKLELELSLAHDKDDYALQLSKLKVSKDLQPLPGPLEWSFDLVLADSAQSKGVFEDLIYSLLITVQILTTRVSDLYEVIEQKDYHLKAVAEVMSNAGGSYNPRVHKAEYQPFNQKEFDSKPLDRIKNNETLTDAALGTLRKYSGLLEIEEGRVRSTTREGKRNENQNGKITRVTDKVKEYPAVEWDPIVVSTAIIDCKIHA
jgi:XLF-Cernunnos, XRcc4-like factor, NHEJ component